MRHRIIVFLSLLNIVAGVKLANIIPEEVP